MVKRKLNKPAETSTKNRTDYRTVTELSGEKVSQEQVERIYQRYYWADIYCRNKSVLEVACGSGQGIGYLADLADSFTGGDISEDILALQGEGQTLLFRCSGITLSESQSRYRADF